MPTKHLLPPRPNCLACNDQYGEIRNSFVSFWSAGNHYVSIVGSSGKWIRPMAAIAYVPKYCIERRNGPVRYAHIAGEASPVIFSVHEWIANHYGVKAEDFGESHASTIDYPVASVGS
jgi:hypothetical protein